MTKKDDDEGLTEVMKWRENERIWTMTCLNESTLMIVSNFSKHWMKVFLFLQFYFCNFKDPEIQSRFPDYNVTETHLITFIDAIQITVEIDHMKNCPSKNFGLPFLPFFLAL